MNTRTAMVIINIIGGLAVLGSYAWGLLGFPETRGEIWGGVPESMKPFYTYSMLTAAAGYFLFTPFFLFRVDPQKLNQSGPFSFSIINWLYLLVLIPSALWLPLTFEVLQAPSDFLWLLVRLVLAATALGSLGLLYALVRLRSHAGAVGFWLAILGILAFNLQTTILDALVWTSYFPYPNPM